MKHNYALRKKSIISRPSRFQEIIRKGNKIEGKKIKIYYLPVETKGLKAGFSTSKMLRRAVERNRVRRLMKEVFRLHQEELEKGYHYIFVWSGDLGKEIYRDVEKEVLRLLKSSNLLIK